MDAFFSAQSLYVNYTRREPKQSNRIPEVLRMHHYASEFAPLFRNNCTQNGFICGTFSKPGTKAPQQKRPAQNNQPQNPSWRKRMPQAWNTRSRFSSRSKLFLERIRALARKMKSIRAYSRATRRKRKNLLHPDGYIDSLQVHVYERRLHARPNSGAQIVKRQRHAPR